MFVVCLCTSCIADAINNVINKALSLATWSHKETIGSDLHETQIKFAVNSLHLSHYVNGSLEYEKDGTWSVDGSTVNVSIAGVPVTASYSVSTGILTINGKQYSKI